MNSASDQIEDEINQLYRSHYGRMLTSLLNFSSEIDLDSAEDLVQDAFTAALSDWKKNGLPINAAGWIYTVCKNKALNTIRERRKVRGIIDQEVFQGDEFDFPKSAVDDQQLKLLFACAHPDLSPKVQVIVTLKYVLNLKVLAIANVFGMTIDGVDKLLGRARQKIRDEKILLLFPDLTALKPRLPIVHKIIYLIFNEGYKSSWGKEILREELCQDAMLMNKELIDKGIGNKETYALQALMLFNASRFKARFGYHGEIKDLEEQDRLLWNQDLILLAFQFLKKSWGENSSYHLEASIASIHCTAQDFDSTDWLSISKLYQQLLQINSNPFVELNYAIALYYSGQKEKALSILDELERNPFLNQYYLFNATLGKIHFLEGNHRKAKDYLIKTLGQTNLQIEKDFVMNLIKKIQD
jgi:RNA polymerase sigma factor (sigma-70 family)